MREGYSRPFREISPPRSLIGESRPASSAMGHERTASEQPRKTGVFGTPQYQRESAHSFRAFQPPPQEMQPGMNSRNGLTRPSSQPVDPGPPRSLEDIIRRDAPPDGALASFRHLEPSRHEMNGRHEPLPFSNGNGPTSQPVERGVFSSPLIDRNPQQENPLRFRPSTYATPMREDQTGLFRPALSSGPEAPQESIEARHFQDMRRDMPRASPPLNDLAPFQRMNNGFPDRPMTWEEHQRMEARPMTWEEHQRMEAIHREQDAIHREQELRKESEGSMHRVLLNLSPELSRRGRNSPLPQAVQGAQPRHVGPGGNSGVKMEFGRMFSGLGSGVGSATPTAGQSVNGAATPSRLSPARHLEGGDLVRTAVAEIEEVKGGSRGRGRGGKKGGRRYRDEDEKPNGNGRETPDTQRGGKRPKHHHHHVHHHHHRPQEADNGPSPFNTLRFPSHPPPSHPGAAQPTAHHYHHHAGAHHHHRPPPRSAPRSVPVLARKPTSTVMSRRLVEEYASKPRKHLGSQLYTTELSSVPVADSIVDLKIKFSSKMKPIPVFKDQENCTYTVRVPRRYLASHDSGPDSGAFEDICRRRQVWGTDVYTDDTNVVAAAVHSGWIKGDFGEYNQDIQALFANDSEPEEEGESPDTLVVRPRKPVKMPQNRDAHFTLLILPPLDNYASTTQHHLRSREWADTHDGMSFMIHRIDFVDEGPAARYSGRGAKARKQKVEEAKRRDAAASLLMFASGGANGTGAVSVGA